MTANVYVLDTETTGLNGAAAGDKVVEIGVSRVDLDRGKVYPEYGRIVRQELTETEKNAWVFQNTDLTPEEVENSPYSVFACMCPLALYGRGDFPFTAYNRAFDFDLFLSKAPYSFEPRKMAPCIMETCAGLYNGGRWFRAQEAYDMLCPDNPAGVPDGKEEHRALSDAVLEGYILLAVCEDDEDTKESYLEACLEGIE